MASSLLIVNPAVDDAGDFSADMVRQEVGIGDRGAVGFAVFHGIITPHCRYISPISPSYGCRAFLKSHVTYGIIYLLRDTIMSYVVKLSLNRLIV